MSTLLQINSSLFADAGQSSQLAQRFVDAWKARHVEGRIILRDLAADPVPHITAARFQSFLTPAGERSAEQAAVVAYSDALIDELKAADTIVLGLPMYNFGVPSWLKSWIDHIARAGSTFKYTEKGPIGLLTGKKAYVFAARGGAYLGTPLDTQTSYIRDFLRFIGIADVEFVYAEGLAMGEPQKQAALEAARGAVDRLAA